MCSCSLDLLGTCTAGARCRLTRPRQLTLRHKSMLLAPVFHVYRYLLYICLCVRTFHGSFVYLSTGPDIYAVCWIYYGACNVWYTVANSSDFSGKKCQGGKSKI